PPAHILICTGGCVLQMNPNPAQLLGIISFLRPKKLGLVALIICYGPFMFSIVTVISSVGCTFFQVRLKLGRLTWMLR
ncbi:MAG: hypothetical protein KJP07_10220, partial [Desulfatitalea sp.]|nr:hypothetical protein [Desulfatitalea sp.]